MNLVLGEQDDTRPIFRPKVDLWSASPAQNRRPVSRGLQTKKRVPERQGETTSSQGSASQFGAREVVEKLTKSISYLAWRLV